MPDTQPVIPKTNLLPGRLTGPNPSDLLTSELGTNSFLAKLYLKDEAGVVRLIGGYEAGSGISLSTTGVFTINVGTIAGTICAGDDSRVVNAINRNGDTFYGLVTLPASTTSGVGLILSPGVAPINPPAGGLWMTTTGLFGKYGTTTFQVASMAALTSTVAGKADIGHSHTTADIVGYLAGALGVMTFQGRTTANASLTTGDIASLSGAFISTGQIINLTNTINALTSAQMATLTTASIAGLDTALASKAALTHTHAISEVTGLVGQLSSKADLSHSHTTAEITNFAAAAAAAAPVQSVAGRGGAVILTTADIGGFTSSLAALTTNQVAAFAAASHTHTTSQITGLTSMNWTTNQIIGLSSMNWTTNQIIGYQAGGGGGGGGSTAGITALTSDVIASGTGSVVATLSTTGVTPGTYGGAALLSITVDAKGRLSAASVSTTPIVNSVAGRSGAVVLTTSDIGGFTSSLAALTTNQVAAFAAASHTHTTSQITGFTAALAALTTSQVAAFAAASHTHTTTDIVGLSAYIGALTTNQVAAFAAANHTHTTSQITGLTSMTWTTSQITGLSTYIGALTTNQVAGFAAASHTHTTSQITGLTAMNWATSQITGLSSMNWSTGQITGLSTYIGALTTNQVAAFAAASHVHAISDVTNLTAALISKSDVGHTHTTADILNFTSSVISPALIGAANGVASLDGTGKLPVGQLPDLAVTDYLGSVANQTAMLALTGQKGDWCTRADTGTNWIITGSTPSLIGSWTQLSYPVGGTTTLTGDATGSGPGTVSVTLANTAVTPGVYGTTSSALVSFTVDSKGRITGASAAALTTNSIQNFSTAVIDVLNNAGFVALTF